MKALVTGGSGFLGSALCKKLVDEGLEVVVFDDHSRGRPRRLEPLAKHVEVIRGDVRDAEQLCHAAQGCDQLWHLAYINGTRFFYERPDEVLEVGVKGTMNALEAALAAGVKRFVFASTSETYNVPTHVPTTESERLIIPDVTNPRFSYGGGKILGELLTLHFGAKRGLETVIFRPHNFYGPDMGHEHVIPELTRKLWEASQGGEKRAVTIPIQGDGSETRSFCFVDDGAAGCAIAGLRGESGEIYHIGTEEEIAIADLVRLLGEVMGLEVSLQQTARPEGCTPRRCPDISKAAALGFKPGVALRAGLERTVAHYVESFRHGALQAS